MKITSTLTADDCIDDLIIAPEQSIITPELNKDNSITFVLYGKDGELFDIVMSKDDVDYISYISSGG